MKLTASGVANCAAIVRSPSFSRSGGVDDDDHLPLPDVLDRLLDGGECGCGGAHRPMVEGSRRSTLLREDVDLEIDAVRRREGA